jgi:hypothetical protein
VIVSVIGYYVYSDDKEPIRDGGLWAMYDTDEVQKAIEDFRRVGNDLLFERQLDEEREIEFGVDKADVLDAVPKMWKDRKVMKV